MIRIISPFRATIKVFTFIFISVFLFAACSQNSRSLEEVVQRTTQAQPTAFRAPQPAEPQLQKDTQAPVAPEAQIATQAIAPTVNQPAKNAINPCTLITKAEAEAAVGAQVGEPKEDSYPPLYGCRFEADVLKFVGISLIEFNDEQQAEEAFQWEIDLNHYEEVSGIGDRALKPEIGDISVLKGKYEVTISMVNDSDKEACYEKAKELAALAISRLP